jgi:hypothetical protein
MNYTWQLTSLKRKNTSELNNVVVQTYWKKTGTDENGNEGSFSGATPFDLSTVDPTNFTSYEDLTEEAVLGWIQSVVVGDYERHVNEKIAEQIEAIVSPVVSVTGGFPWQPEDEVTEGSSGPAAAAAETAMDVTPTPPV